MGLVLVLVDDGNSEYPSFPAGEEQSIRDKFLVQSLKIPSAPQDISKLAPFAPLPSSLRNDGLILFIELINSGSRLRNNINQNQDY